MKVPLGVLAIIPIVAMLAGCGSPDFLAVRKACEGVETSAQVDVRDGGDSMIIEPAFAIGDGSGMAEHLECVAREAGAPGSFIAKVTKLQGDSSQQIDSWSGVKATWTQGAGGPTLILESD